MDTIAPYNSVGQWKGPNMPCKCDGCKVTEYYHDVDKTSAVKSTYTLVLRTPQDPNGVSVEFTTDIDDYDFINLVNEYISPEIQLNYEEE